MKSVWVKKHLFLQCFCRNEVIKCPVPIGWRFWGSQTTFGIWAWRREEADTKTGAKAPKWKERVLLTYLATVFFEWKPFPVVKYSGN